MEDRKRVYEAIFLEQVNQFINNLAAQEQGRIAAQIEMIQTGQFEAISTKLLKRPIKELIVGKYRFIFFIDKHLIYFIYAFVKKTKKTPKQYIKLSETIYKSIKK